VTQTIRRGNKKHPMTRCRRETEETRQIMNKGNINKYRTGGKVGKQSEHNNYFKKNVLYRLGTLYNIHQVTDDVCDECE